MDYKILLIGLATGFLIGVGALFIVMEQTSSSSMQNQINNLQIEVNLLQNEAATMNDRINQLLQSTTSPPTTNYNSQVIDATNPLLDNFEGYTVGTLPTQNWQFWYNTEGAITDSTYISRTKSLQLTAPADYWFTTIGVRSFSTNARFIGYQVYGKVDSFTTYASLRVGFLINIPENSSTAWHALVQFADVNGTQMLMGCHDELQGYSPNTWYKIKVILDRDTDNFNVWINDSLVASNIKDISSGNDKTNPYALQYFGVAAIKSNTNCYFDDVQVFVASSING
ncbi:MAG: hypothetical protein ABSA11_15600 [Candidatus Bathyarchaeia archaeon]|jgi:hypothetical protein